MRRLRHGLILFSLLCLGLNLMAPQSLRAAEAFFEALYDVPVMAGLEEVKDEAMLFDKPGGRIASVVAASKTLSVADITGFYAVTLPQMGWKKTSENQYVRDGDQLKLELSKRPPLTVVHFTLSPRDP